MGKISCYHEGLSAGEDMPLKKGREGTGNRESIRGVKRIHGMGNKLDSHLGYVTTSSAHVLREG